jgi:cleavage and polyadenylation specificity factor subunit 3
MTPEDADPKQEKSSSPGSHADTDPVEDKISVAEADVAS